MARSVISIAELIECNFVIAISFTNSRRLAGFCSQFSALVSSKFLAKWPVETIRATFSRTLGNFEIGAGAPVGCLVFAKSMA